MKATIDMGLAHRDSILKNIASDFEQWNNLVSFTCFLHEFDEILCFKKVCLLLSILSHITVFIIITKFQNQCIGQEGKSNLSHLEHAEC